MIEKILKDTYVTPRVELTQNDYNHLVQMATMKAKKIEERAREIYEAEGIVKIQFDGRVKWKRNGEYETEHYKFDCDCEDYHVSPSGDFDKSLFFIPQKMRERIADMVCDYVEGQFESNFGEHMKEISYIERRKAQIERERRRFIIVTIVGWMMALAMFIGLLIR